MSYTVEMEPGETGELINHLRILNQHKIADWVAKRAIEDDRSDWEKFQDLWDRGEF